MYATRKSSEFYKVVNAIINTLRSGDCVAYVSTGNGGAGFGLYSPSDDDMELRKSLLKFHSVDSIDVDYEEELCEEWKGYSDFDKSFDFYELSMPGTENPYRMQVMINPDMYADSYSLREVPDIDSESDEYVIYALSLFLRDETLTECPIKIVSRDEIKGEDAQLIHFTFGEDESSCVAVVYDDGTVYTPYDWQTPEWDDEEWEIDQIEWMDCRFIPCINLNGMPRML